MGRKIIMSGLGKSNTLSFVMSYGKECVLEMETKSQNIMPQTMNLLFGKIRIARLMH